MFYRAGVLMIYTRSEHKRIWFGAILWPSFLGALVLSFIVFSSVDPAEVLFFGYLSISRATAYTLGFFIFWLVGGLMSFVTAKIIPPEYNEEE